jgi:hypothetical protein
MKVWIVAFVNYDGHDIKGVFSTEQKAINYFENGPTESDSLEILEIEVDYLCK